MPETPTTSSLTPSTPDPIEETKRTLNALVERIYDSQKKMNNFLTDEAGEVLLEDFSEFFADLHLKVSGAYEAYKHGDYDDDGGAGTGQLLANVTLTCLGLCRRLGYDVGKLILDLVVTQAQEAAELEQKSAPGSEENANADDYFALADDLLKAEDGGTALGDDNDEGEANR